MITKEIMSLQHPIVKHLVKLRKNKHYRLQKQAIFIEGKKIVTEIAKQLHLKRLVILKGTSCPPDIQAQECNVVSQAVFQKLTGTPSPEYIAAELSMPTDQPLFNKKRLLAFEEINDPGNMGSMFRSALALGFEGVFMTPKSVDPFHEKVIRSSKGACLLLPIQIGSLEDLNLLIQKGCFHLYAASIEGISCETISFQLPLILLLGNEARGLSVQSKQLGKLIRIPISSSMESLNVGTASAILMYKMGKNFDFRHSQDK